MSEHSRLLRKGARSGVLGSPSDLCIAAPLTDGDYDPAAHTAAGRIGFYFDRTASAEKLGAVVMGTDIFALYAGGLATSGYLRPGNTSDTTAGNIRWTGTDLEGHKGGDWVSLTGPAGPTSTDGGSASEVYLASQFIDGGSASGVYLTSQPIDGGSASEVYLTSQFIDGGVA